MMPEFTKVTWSEPSRRERPMQGFWPHSVQKRYLGSTEKHTVSFMCFSFLLFFFARFAHRRQNKYNCNNNKKNLKCGQKSHGLPFLRMDGDGPRLIQSFRYDHWAVRTIQTGNFDEIETVVCPIEVSWWTDGGKKSNNWMGKHKFYWSSWAPDLWRLRSHSYSKTNPPLLSD